MTKPLRSDDAAHWILPDPGSAACEHVDDRGWRLRVMLEDAEMFAEITDEQVWPECVDKVANHVRTERGVVRVRLDDARWLRDRIDTIINELERRQDGDA